MDLFKLGLRSVLGIALPGAVLAIVLIYFVLSSAWAFGQPLPVALWAKEGQATVIVVFFLLSYLLGSVLRLNSADRVDRASGSLLLKRFRRKNPAVAAAEGEFTRARKDLLAGRREDVPDGFDSWVWMAEGFPYPAWQLRKSSLYHPQEFSQFFTPYRHCMWREPDNQGKAFFNFCKLSIAASCRQPGDALLEEIHYAEATARFYAGVHLALVVSCWALALVLPLQLWAVLNGQIAARAGIVAAAVSAGLAAGAFAMSRQIVARFRTLRLKEVDCVYEAFYLTSLKAVVPSQSLAAPLEHIAEATREREALVREAFSAGGTDGPVVLERLVSLMKDRSRRHAYLSSLYFAGAEVDHPYFLENDRIAIGLAVLPEDAAKAGVAKRHPHQQEMLVVLDGVLRLGVEGATAAEERVLEEGDVFIIPAGCCHRITPVGDKGGVYLFVKTHPSRMPREEICALLTES
jgi:mannose-6-phosphate isomerase-like protein (cupin superfamily)